jgi:hypothetical protein
MGGTKDKGQRQITDKKDVGFLVLNYFSKFCLLLSVFLLPVLQYSNTPILQCFGVPYEDSNCSENGAMHRMSLLLAGLR